MSVGVDSAAASTPRVADNSIRRTLAIGARRGLDLFVAVLLLVLAIPVLAIVALAIRLDSPGPALYRQRRVGRNRKPFTVLKLRTMQQAADSAPHREYVRSLIGNSNGHSPSHGGLYKLAVDDRVTRVGRLLRKTSLDELPQLWNVMRGDMSLVGPRPVIEYEVEQYPDWYLRRFAVKPGMTGLWQVSGRNELTYEDMVRYDIEYAERRSLWLDVRILARTALVVVRGRGAV